jgi:hypothetical protein
MTNCLRSEYFTLYSDEFGHPDDPNRMTMGIAGLMAPSEKWSKFAEHWESYLTLDNVPQPFHMTDFIHQKNAFSQARWQDEEERAKVLAGLLSIIQEIDPMPVAATVLLADYNGLTDSQKKACKSPYHLAFQAVTGNMGFAASSLDLATKSDAALEAIEKNSIVDSESFMQFNTVSMVYAKLKGYTGPAEELWKAIKDVHIFGGWMNSYAVSEPQTCPPLQAADIWAYCVGRYGETNRLLQNEVEKTLKFFIDLAMKGTHGAPWFTFLNREEILARIGEA